MGAGPHLVPTCNEFNQPLGVAENTDCSGGPLSVCKVCTNGPIFYEGCVTSPGTDCELFPTALDCGDLRAGACWNGVCQQQQTIGSCYDAPLCQDVEP